MYAFQQMRSLKFDEWKHINVDEWNANPGFNILMGLVCLPGRLLEKYLSYAPVSEKIS